MGERKRKVIDTHFPGEASAANGPEVSTLLRDSRIGLGHALPDVARTLRIRLVYLQAIEEGRFSDLPGAAYAAGFLRSYSEFLGLDADFVVRRFKEEMAGKARKQELYFPTPVPEGRIPGGTVLLGTLVLAGMVYGGWYYLSATDRSLVDFVPALPDRLLSLIDTLSWPAPAPAPSETSAVAEAPRTAGEPHPRPVVPAPSPAPGVAAAGAPGPGGTTNVPSATAPSTTVPSATGSAATGSAATAPLGVAALPSGVLPPARPGTAAPAAAPAPADSAPALPGDDEADTVPQEPTPVGAAGTVAAPGTATPGTAGAAARPAPAQQGTLPAPTRVYGSQNANSRVQIRATQDSWVQVRDGTGEILFTRVLRPGDLYRVPDRPGVKLRTGNAGGLIPVTDGTEGQPMGAVGQVLRDVTLEAPGGRPTGGQ